MTYTKQNSQAAQFINFDKTTSMRRSQIGREKETHIQGKRGTVETLLNFMLQTIPLPWVQLGAVGHNTNGL